MADAESRPNVLLLHAHDLGDVLGCYGWDVETPNIDSIAADGARFENYFCSAPQCGPSRSSIHTGMYPHNNGLMGHHWLGWDIDDDVTTLAEALCDSGYSTHQFGGQHLAADPADVGFKESGEVGFGHVSEVAEETVDFLDSERAAGDEPFFASVGFLETHLVDSDIEGYQGFTNEAYPPTRTGDDVDGLPYLPDLPAVREDLAGLFGMAETLDDGVGTILDALDDAGLAENTLVVFTADHGIAFPRAKGMCYDPGHKTPLLLRLPGEIDGPTTHDELLSNVDLMPTLLDVLGVSVPEGIDGRSFRGLVDEGEYEPRDRIYLEITFHDKYNPIRAVRTENYKYIRNFGDLPKAYFPSDVKSMRSGRALFEEFYGEKRPDRELYDLEADPHEQVNLAEYDVYPEIRESLADDLEAWMERTDDPLLDGPVETPPEHVENLERAPYR